jgi:hypothetical protein
LFFIIEPEHIETVCCDVMRSGTERQQPEKSKSQLYIMGSRNKEGYPRKSGSDETLHGNNPGAFRFHQVDERTP